MKRTFGNLSTDVSFLDVGCGVGECLRLLPALGFHNVRGVDFAHEMVSAATASDLPVFQVDVKTDEAWPEACPIFIDVKFRVCLHSYVSDNTGRADPAQDAENGNATCIYFNYLKQRPSRRYNS